MKFTVKTSFIRDAKKCPVHLRAEIEKVFTQIESANKLEDLTNLKKLKGHSSAFRIKIDTFRLCFFYESGEIILARFLPRKDVYRFFP